MDPDLITLHALRHALAHARAALLALDSGQHDRARALLEQAERAPELGKPTATDRLNSAK